jgi:hypothetical protein
MTVWMSHGDQITEMPPKFRSLAYTENSTAASSVMITIFTVFNFILKWCTSAGKNDY